MKFYDLACSTWDADEVKAIHDTVASGMLTMGANVEQFERGFADKHSMKHAIMVNSGSSANLVGVAALCFKQERPLQRGDEVIVPAISWATTYHPLQQYGLKLRFLDVELDTLNIDVAKLEEALTPKTRMVVAVSILGNPCALDVLRKFCDKHGLYLFEDNCESMGAELGGKRTGTFGEINTFSSFFSHHISTMEGGLILTNDDELAHLCRSLRAHGWTRGLPADTKIYQKKSDDFFEAYRFILPGYNVRPLEIEGAIGLCQLSKLDRLIEARRKNAALFRTFFEKDERFITQRENGKSSWFSFTMILNPKLKIDREKVFQKLQNADIGFRIITGGCFLRHDAIKYFDYDCVGEIVHANTAHDRGFFVGNHPVDLTPQIEALHRALKTV